MGKYIFVFTNFVNLLSVDTDLAQKANIPCIEGNNFIGFNESLGEFEVVNNLGTVHSVYFIHDGVQESEFEKFIGNTSKLDVFILRHRLPVFNFAGFPLSNIERGMHESTGPFYNKVLQIITDAENQKFDRIFNELFTHDHILEAKLTLLAFILDGKLTLQDVIGVIVDDHSTKVERLFEPVFKADRYPNMYPSLCARVLQSKESLSGVEVSLEDKLTSLKNDFRTYLATGQDNIFSVEYRLAFERFRDVLGIQ